MAATPKPVRKVAKKFGKEYSEKVKSHPAFKDAPKSHIKKIKKFNESSKKTIMKMK